MSDTTVDEGEPETHKERMDRLAKERGLRHSLRAPYLYRLVHHKNFRLRKTWNDEWGNGTMVIKIEGGLWRVKQEVVEMLLAAGHLIPPQHEDEGLVEIEDEEDEK